MDCGIIMYAYQRWVYDIIPKTTPSPPLNHLIPGIGCSLKWYSYLLLVKRWKHTPAATRPARPLLCRALARDTQAKSRLSMPFEWSYLNRKSGKQTQSYFKGSFRNHYWQWWVGMNDLGFHTSQIRIAPLDVWLNLTSLNISIQSKYIILCSII